MAIRRKFPEVVLSFGSLVSNQAGSQGSLCLREVVGVGVLRDIGTPSLKGDLVSFCSPHALRSSQRRKRKKHLGSPARPLRAQRPGLSHTVSRDQGAGYRDPTGL